MDNQLTETIRRRYDRRARLYDFMETGLESLWLSRWRRWQWSRVKGHEILEIGVGTGKNLRYYPAGSEVTAIDFSEPMLSRARRKAAKLTVEARLIQMDVQKLDFADGVFDTVAATFVFCSVPDPVLGLKEVARVCKPGGKVILLEHVLSANPLLSWLMNVANPVIVRLSGVNINRRTVENVAKSELTIEKVTDLGLGIVKLIEARKQEK